MKKYYLYFASLMIASSSFGQDSTAISVEKQLDFWLGSWELTWQDGDDKQGKGSNQITRELDGQVICENFQAQKGQLAGFTGRSWSVYDKRNKTWKQTWVDNQGAYLDFIGGKEGDGFVFKRNFTLDDGREIHQKMVFYDIQANQFTWDWMQSADGGQNWKLAWRIHYKRLAD